MEKLYNRINWEAYPSKNTPTSAENFNKMDKGIDDLDNRLLDFEIKKAQGTSLELETQKGGMRFNEIVGNTHKSANLLNLADSRLTWGKQGYYTEPIIEENKVEISPKASSGFSQIMSSRVSLNYFNLVAEKTYTLKSKVNGATGDPVIIFEFFDSNNTKLLETSYYMKTRDSLTFTVPTNTEKTNIIVRADQQRMQDSGTVIFYDMQINEGETALPFEPYGMHSVADTIGYVKANELTWEYNSANKAWLTRNLTNLIKKPSSADEKANIYMIYPTVSASVGYGVDEKHVYARTDGIIFVNNGKTDVAPSEEYISYELAENATPSNYAIVVKENNKNLWDEEWELGDLYESDGTNKTSTNTIRSKNFSEIKNVSKLFGTISDTTHIYFYDKNKNFITPRKNINNVSVDVPTDAKFFRLRMGQGYGATYKNDIAIIEGTSGTYTPHASKQFPIPLPRPLCEVNGIKDRIVKKDGKWYANYKLCIVELNTLSWTYSTTNEFFTSLFNDFAENVNYISSDYNNIGLKYDGAMKTVQDKSIAYAGKYFKVKDMSLSSTEKPSGKLVYELAQEEFVEITEQKALYLLESYADKTYIDTVDGLATLDIDYGKSDVVAELLSESNELGTVKAEETIKCALISVGTFVIANGTGAYKPSTLPELPANANKMVSIQFFSEYQNVQFTPCPQSMSQEINAVESYRFNANNLRGAQEQIKVYAYLYYL